jgi:hypothetical protein
MQLFQKEKKLVTLEKYSRKKHKTHPSHEAVWIADDGLQCHDQPIRGLRTVVRPSLEFTHEHAFTSLARLGDVHFLFFLKKKTYSGQSAIVPKQLGEHASSRRCWRAVCLGTVPAHQQLLTTKRAVN